LPIKKFDVNGAAKVWCRTTIDKKDLLAPCLSYTVNAELSNGEIIPTVIDVLYPIGGLK